MNRIREMRKRLGMTQCMLAKRAHTTQASISRYETGEKEFTLKTAAKIAAALHCKVDDLIKEGESA